MGTLLYWLLHLPYSRQLSQVKTTWIGRYQVPPSANILFTRLCTWDWESTWAEIFESFTHQMLYLNQFEKVFIDEGFQLLNRQVAVAMTMPSTTWIANSTRTMIHVHIKWMLTGPNCYHTKEIKAWWYSLWHEQKGIFEVHQTKEALVQNSLHSVLLWIKCLCTPRIWNC